MKKLFLSIVTVMTSLTMSYAQKSLILYYSETGTTKTVAQELQKQLGADLESIEAVEPYSGNFQSRGMDGKEGTSIIYVTVGKEQGAKPEFTEVVR